MHPHRHQADDCAIGFVASSRDETPRLVSVENERGARREPALPVGGCPRELPLVRRTERSWRFGQRLKAEGPQRELVSQCRSPNRECQGQVLPVRECMLEFLFVLNRIPTKFSPARDTSRTGQVYLQRHDSDRHHSSRHGASLDERQRAASDGVLRSDDGAGPRRRHADLLGAAARGFCEPGRSRDDSDRPGQ